MEAHLAECESCAEHLRQIRITVAVTGRIHEEDLAPAVRDDLMDLYRRWRRDRPAS
jgi:anti-sigma factor RsiW